MKRALTIIASLALALFLTTPVSPESISTGGIMGRGKIVIGNKTVKGNWTWQDSKKACFGDDNDMCIYWDGTLGYIEFASAGDLLRINGLLDLNDGDDNVGIGTAACDSLTAGSSINNVCIGSAAGTAITLGDNNILIGRRAGESLTTGGKNTIIGGEAGKVLTSSENTLIGFDAGVSLTSAIRNVFLGHEAGAQLTTEDDLLVIDNSNTLTPLLYGEFDNDKYQIRAALVSKYTVTADSLDGNSTHTIAEMLGGLIVRSGLTTGGKTDVTDTAANMVGGMAACVVGSGFEFSIQNADDDQTVALDGGTDVTISPNDPSTAIAAGDTGRFLVYVTDCSASEAVTVYALGASTH